VTGVVSVSVCTAVWDSACSAVFITFPPIRLKLRVKVLQVAGESEGSELGLSFVCLDKAPVSGTLTSG
jgi:hypothetical protein